MQSERADHQQTCSVLEQERERARLVEAELAILKRQLSREKTTFENASVCNPNTQVLKYTSTLSF